MKTLVMPFLTAFLKKTPLLSYMYLDRINSTVYVFLVRITVTVKFLEITTLKIIFKILFLYKVVTMPFYVLIQST